MHPSFNSSQNGPGRRWPKSGANWPQALLLHSQENENLPAHDRIYSSLRKMILYNEIQPGSWLRQTEVSEQFQVSRTPIREAFRSLSQEGLVEIVPNHGVQVSALSVEEFEEIYALRKGIEGLAARLVAQQISVDQVSTLEAKLAALEGFVDSAELKEYLRYEWQFRVDCYSSLGRDRLLARILFLREHSERYIYLAYGAKTKVAESFDFHRRLLEAIKSRDGGHAEVINQAALEWTLNNATPIVIDIINQSSD
ncbi:MAG: GntR family transcriptional regulator [Cyanobacteria bacterium J06623_4]